MLGRWKSLIIEIQIILKKNFVFHIVGAGLGLPLLGNIVGFVVAKMFKAPAADISMIIPIAVSILTPLPMIIFIIIKKTRE